MHETMGLSGTDCLWIFGNPYNLGGWDPKQGYNLLAIDFIQPFFHHYQLKGYTECANTQ